MLEGKPPSDLPISPGLAVGSVVAVSGQVAVDPDTGRVVGSTVAEQTRQALKNVEAVVRAAGLQIDDVFKTTVFLTDASAFEEMNDVYRTFFSVPRPARSTVVVRLVRPDLLVEIEALAWLPTE